MITDPQRATAFGALPTFPRNPSSEHPQEQAAGNELSRRQALRLGAGALLTLGLWPGCVHVADKESGSFNFIAINDTHYMTPECGEFLSGVVAQMKKHEGVEFCVIAGDIVDKGQLDHLAAVRDIFQGLGVPVYTQIGNHDYGTQADRSAYEEIFPGRLNYMFHHHGWQFVGLDTSDGVRYEKTLVQGPTLAWVDENLSKLEKKRPTVIFTHFPLGTGVNYRPLNMDDLLERFEPYNLRAAFSGHYHGLTERTVGDAIVTTNRCCSLKRGNHDRTVRKGYFLCRATGDGEIQRTFIEVPA